MTTDGFDRALPPVLVHEGGKVDHPSDPGGRTNQGVTRRVYDAWRRASNLPVRDVYLMDDTERDAIYRKQYWDAIQGDKLPAGVDYVVFDGAVNSGPKQAIKWLQRALGDAAGPVDGVLGMMTLDALDAVNDHDALIERMCTRRMTFLKALKTWKTFGKGWSRRVADVEKRGQAWATGRAGSAASYIPGAERPAVLEDARKAPPKAPADAIGGAGLGGGLIGQGIQQLTPYDNFTFVKTLIVWLTVAGVAVLVAAGAYRLYAQHRQNQLDDALDSVKPGTAGAV